MYGPIEYLKDIYIFYFSQTIHKSHINIHFYGYFYINFDVHVNNVYFLYTEGILSVCMYVCTTLISFYMHFNWVFVVFVTYMCKELILSSTSATVCVDLKLLLLFGFITAVFMTVKSSWHLYKIFKHENKVLFFF